MEATFVVVGGGIAGVSCVEVLGYLEPSETVILVSESSLVKSVSNVRAVTKLVLDFDVEEKSFEEFEELHPNLRVVQDRFIEVDDVEKWIKTESGSVIKYKYLCLCNGAKAKLIPEAENNPFVLGIRDTDSVEKFVEKLKKSKKIMIVGNGGIASELVYKIENTEIIWVIKDKHISATFVDPGAAEFFKPTLKQQQKPDNNPIKRLRYKHDPSKPGAALGPDWYTNYNISGSSTIQKNIQIHPSTTITSIQTNPNSQNPITATLSDSTTITCDLIISATGVEPQGTAFTSRIPFSLSPDGGLQVDDHMRTSLPDIYAAGDVCNANWPHAKHWFQMKLWTQARQMGCYAARCMSGALRGEEVLQDFCFEMFAHTTRLFGYKVILLGLYNGQKLGRDYELLVRTTKGVEYVKLVMEHGRLQGAVLIGETDLEEMCENLILNQLDLTPFGDDILNPDIDIEDYFD